MKAGWLDLLNGNRLNSWENQQVQQEQVGVGRLMTLLLVLLGALLGLQNPLTYGMAPGFDASLFATMGKMWADGDVLYRDMVDIKGPVIFLFDALGYKLGGFPGIALLEAALLAWGLNQTYRALGLLAIRPLSRWLALLFVVSLCGFRYYYGNMTEDYTLCLALIAFLPFMRMLVAPTFTWRDSLLPAITFGFIAMMRLNNAAFWGAWYAALFLLWVVQGRWLDGFKLFVSAIAGLAVVAVPLVWYFWAHDVLENFWFYSFAIFMGKSYGNGFSLGVGAVGLFRTGLFALLIPACWLLLQGGAAQIANSRWQARGLILFLVLGALFGVVANSVSGHIYDHYDQLYLALIPLPLALLIDSTRADWSREHGLRWLGLMLLPGLVVYLVMPHWLFGWTRYEWPMSMVLSVLGKSLGLAVLAGLLVLGVDKSKTGRRWLVAGANLVAVLALPVFAVFAIWTGTHSGRPSSVQTENEIRQIRAETGPADRIWVEGIIPQYYVWTDRRPASSYLFFDNVTPPFDVKARVLAELKQSRPKFIVFSTGRLKKFREDPNSFQPSWRALFEYELANYQQVQPALFKRPD